MIHPLLSDQDENNRVFFASCHRALPTSACLRPRVTARQIFRCGTADIQLRGRLGLLRSPPSHNAALIARRVQRFTPLSPALVRVGIRPGGFALRLCFIPADSFYVPFFAAPPPPQLASPGAATFFFDPLHFSCMLSSVASLRWSLLAFVGLSRSTDVPRTAWQVSISLPIEFRVLPAYRFIPPDPPSLHDLRFTFYDERPLHPHRPAFFRGSASLLFVVLPPPPPEFQYFPGSLAATSSALVA